MGVRHPSEISEAFGRAFNKRDMDALLALYMDNAILTYIARFGAGVCVKAL